MSESATPAFELQLRQLSNDAREANLELPVVQRSGVSSKELRKLLTAAAATSLKVEYPLTPEIRINGPTGSFVVQLKEKRLNLVSWASAKSRSGIMPADDIYSAITGEVEEREPIYVPPTPAAAANRGAASRKEPKAPLRKGLIMMYTGILGLIIIGVNLFTLSELRRPPGNFLPPYRLLEPGPAERLLTSVAGAYETGSGNGDRRLQISKDGKVKWIKFGNGRSSAEERNFTVQGAESNDRPSLLTSRKSMIKVKDPITLTYFGDTYVRVAQ